VKTKYDQERTYGIGAVFRYVSDLKDYMVVHAGGNRVMLVSVNVWRNVRVFGHRSVHRVHDLDAITYAEMHEIVGVYFERLVYVEREKV